MKYKVGDKVRVKSDLEEGRYSGIWFVEKMMKYRGEVYTIKSIEDDEETTAIHHYKLNNIEDYLLNNIEDYFWSEEMLEPVLDNCSCCSNNSDKATYSIAKDGFKINISPYHGECKLDVYDYDENGNLEGSIRGLKFNDDELEMFILMMRVVSENM